MIVRTVRDRIGGRGLVLLFFALLGGSFCFGLLDPQQPVTRTYAWAGSVLPLWVWAILWGGAGLTSLVCAFQERDSVAFGAMIAVSAWWGLLVGAGWLLGDVQRGYVTAVIFLVFSGAVYAIGAGMKRKGRAGAA